MITEADTCRKYVLPKLSRAGWDNDPHSFTEQKTFTDGRIIAIGQKIKRQKQKRADYLLRYTRDFMIAVVEAKAAYKLPGDGLGQAKEYADILGLKFAYSTNGHGIIEFDYLTGKEREIESFPSPKELWERLQSGQKLKGDSEKRLLTPSYVQTGRGHLSRFQELETVAPVIVTTSKLLTTGVDVPTCKNVVLVRVINAMTEFKQIIGRGTRVRDDYDKFFFNILDYTGSATRLFADPEFDGEPALITEEGIDAEGKSSTYEIVEGDVAFHQPEMEWEVPPTVTDDSEGQRRKYYFDGGHVEIVAHIVHELDSEGKQLRVVKFTDYTAEKVRTLYPSAIELRRRWANPEQRSEVIGLLEERGIDFEELSSAANQPDADPFDLLCHIAYNAPLRTRRERADRLRKDKKDIFDQYGPEAKMILNELLDKYADYGTAQFIIPDVLKVPPISKHGNVIEIANCFGGPEKLKEAVNQLQTLLYAA